VQLKCHDIGTCVHEINLSSGRLITLRELMTFLVLDEITDKKVRETKVFNDEIVSN
jgi:hypothetical protein